MYIKKVILPCLLLVFLISCGKNRDVRLNLVNKRVNLSLDKMEKLNNQVGNTFQTSSITYRFVAYYDSAQCSQCTLLHGSMWNRLQMETTDIDYMMIFCPRDKDASDALRRAHAMMKPQQRIFIDSLGVFERDNELLVKKFKAHAFLLDGDNRIVFVGDPTKDLATQEAYLHVVDSLARNRETDKKHTK